MQKELLWLCSVQSKRHENGYLGAGVGVRQSQLTPRHVVLFQALQEPGDVQAQAAHNLTHKLIADAGDVGGLLDL